MRQLSALSQATQQIGHLRHDGGTARLAGMVCACQRGRLLVSERVVTSRDRGDGGVQRVQKRLAQKDDDSAARRRVRFAEGIVRFQDRCGLERVEP